jgi:TolB-like protein
MGTVSARGPVARVAVFPVENLSGGGAPVGEIRQFVIDRLASAGVAVLGDDALEAFLARHRVRYTAGIDAATAESLRREEGVDGVVFASLELFSELAPPKVALTVRLVSIAAAPVVVWADDAGLAGDDAPGFLALGLVDDYQVLLSRALDRLAASLVAHLETGEAAPVPEPASRFRPKMSYRNLAVEPGKTYSVAVVPFVNLSDRRNAGEILALLFTRHLSGFPQFRVVEAGVTRRQLLDARIIMDGGPSLDDAETVASLVEADFVLGGRVLRYADYEGLEGRTSVDFSTVLIEKKSRRVVWSSSSYNEGSDGVRFFGRGTSRTAHAMATQMARLATGMLAGRDR